MNFFAFGLTVKERMVGTKNIEKITKSMKMVSAAKLRGDQNRLAAATPFAVRLIQKSHPYLYLIFLHDHICLVGMDQPYYWCGTRPRDC